MIIKVISFGMWQNLIKLTNSAIIWPKQKRQEEAAIYTLTNIVLYLLVSNSVLNSALCIYAMQQLIALCSCSIFKSCLWPTRAYYSPYIMQCVKTLQYKCISRLHTIGLLQLLVIILILQPGLWVVTPRFDTGTIPTIVLQVSNLLTDWLVNII